LAVTGSSARADSADALYERHRAEYERRDALEEQLMTFRHERSEIVSKIQGNVARLSRIESGEEAIGGSAHRNQVIADLNRQSRELQARLPAIIGSEVRLKRELDRPEMKVIIPCPHNPLWDLLDTECAAVTAKIGISGAPGAPAETAAAAGSARAAADSLEVGSREPAPAPRAGGHGRSGIGQ